MRCVVVLPPRHPLAARKLLTPALLSGQPMVAPVRSLQLPPKLQATFAAAGAQLNAVVEAEFYRQPLRPGRGRHRLVAGRSAVGRELQPSRPGRAAVRAGHPLRSRRLPPPRPRAVDAGRRLPRTARGQAWRLSRPCCVSTPGSPPSFWPTPACGATSTTSATAAAGWPAPRARSAPSRCCASGCARPRRPIPAARSPCPTAAGGRRRRPCVCPTARSRPVIRWCAPSPRRATASPPR